MHWRQKEVDHTYGGACDDSIETICVSKLVEEDSPWSKEGREETRALLPSYEVPMSPANAIVKMGIPGHVAKNRLILIILLTQNQSNHSWGNKKIGKCICKV